MSGTIVLILRALLAISMFTFLGWAIFVLWKDLQQSIKNNADFKIPPITIRIIESDLEFTFDLPEFFIGRDPQADLNISDDTLSAIHSRVFYKNSHWMIEDLQSTNGTFINEERLSTPSVLINEDEIMCGQVRLRIHIK
jgi:pSer/pThr/pTyr-binding forkhead associated (FHA) protein